MPKQINFRASDKTLVQLKDLAALWGNQTTALSIASDRAHREEISEMSMKTCKHCGRSFSTERVDIQNHERNCKQHSADVVKGNIERVIQGKRPTRTGR